MILRSLFGRTPQRGVPCAVWRAALLALCLCVCAPAHPAQAWPTSRKENFTPNIDEALLGYAQVEKVKPSRIGAEDFRKVIQTRVQCYEKVTTPLERKKPCNLTYVESIIHVSRKHIRSVPEIGRFVRDVQYCPIMYNMCVGDMNQKDYCVDFERRCIDKALDKYWRGASDNAAHD